MASVPGTPSHRYHPSYCEENVYWLCQELGAASAGDEEWFAVFVSNPSRQVQLTYGSARQPRVRAAGGPQSAMTRLGVPVETARWRKGTR